MFQITLTITGKVQGVFYRAKTQEKAQSLGLVGFARNNSDGSVTVVAEGEKSQLQELITWCHQGPPMASVSNLQAEWQEASGSHDHFEIY